MTAIDPDDLPKKKIAHEMGQDLSLLSVGELADRGLAVISSARRRLYHRAAHFGSDPLVWPPNDNLQ